MIRPFERIRPGEPISASEFNRAMSELERQNNVRVAAPLRYSDGGSGVQLDISQSPHIWARITGHETVGSGAVADLAKYSGVEQTHDDTTDGAYDLDGGLEFFADGLYLKEVNGRTDVPENAIVRAYQSDNGQYYTFLFEQAFSEDYYGTPITGNTEVIRVQTYFCQDTSPLVASPSPLCYYPGVIQRLTAATGFTDSTMKVWWVSPFGYAVWPPVSMSAPYTVVRADGSGYVDGVPAGFDYAPNDGVHPFAGDPRPVYRMARFDGAIGIQCVTIDGVAQEQPFLG